MHEQDISIGEGGIPAVAARELITFEREKTFIIGSAVSKAGQHSGGTTQSIPVMTIADDSCNSAHFVYSEFAMESCREAVSLAYSRRSRTLALAAPSP